ncbi:hypothetical protein LCGC14_1986870 [marine sediment metagenome]|uniref:Uncharacterized protein n=1 Tax=marine sediment metagenome TaxID=412755 RepID=A0A0F9F746_9ZZZZ
MNIIAIACCVIAVLLAGAYVAKFVVEIFKFIYRLAPVIVPLFILALFLYTTGNLNFPEKEVRNADYIESIED